MGRPPPRRRGNLPPSQRQPRTARSDRPQTPLSSAPGFHWTSRWDIIQAHAQEPTPMSTPPNPAERGRFSSPRKTAAVLRLLRGEDLELLSRELGITAATLSGWRDDFL